jgi:NCS1 family nucleobase:cation symporter-1
MGMLAVEETETGVPIREGEYGASVAAIEPGGVEYIPQSERHGTPIQLFWTWMSPNFEFATVYVGVLPIVLFGGGFWLTVVGLLVGTALGAVTHGWLSTFGPRSPSSSRAAPPSGSWATCSPRSSTRSHREPVGSPSTR